MIAEIAGIVMVSCSGIAFLMIIYMAGVKQGQKEMGRSVREYTAQKTYQGEDTSLLHALLRYLRERSNARF